MATIIANRKSSVIENLHVVMGFIRAVCPADNVLSREQGKFLASMVNEAIEEIEGNKKRIDHLEQYKAGWISTVNVVNKNTPLLKEFDEYDFIGVAEYIKSLSVPPTKKSDNTIDVSFDIIDGCGRLLFSYDTAKSEQQVKKENAQEVVDTLNKLLRIDPPAIAKLIGQSVNCNAELVKHTVGLEDLPLPERHSFPVSTLGIINALVSPYVIAAAYDNYELAEFVIWDAAIHSDFKCGGAL